MNFLRPMFRSSRQSQSWLAGARCFGSSNTSSTKFISFEDARSYLREHNFRSVTDWYRWCQAGARPSFIPSNPDRTYRRSGWGGYPDFLGYQRTPARPRQIVSERHQRDRFRSTEFRKKFANFLAERWDGFELRTLPPNLNATHLFRITDADVGVGSDLDVADATPTNDDAKRWVSVQVRLCAPHVRRIGRYYINHTAEPDTGIIIFSTKDGDGVVVGFRDEVGSFLSSENFSAEDIIFSKMREWWSTGVRRTETEWMSRLRGNVGHSDLWTNHLVVLQSKYFDPLAISIMPLVRSDSSAGANALLGGSLRLLVRSATSSTVWRRQTLAVSMHRDFKTYPVSVDFDALMVILPRGRTTEMNDGSHSQEFPEFFMFDKPYLLQSGVLSTASSSGRQTLYLYPPWKEEKRKITSLRKAEQAPYFVSSLDDFRRVLDRTQAQIQQSRRNDGESDVLAASPASDSIVVAQQ